MASSKIVETTEDSFNWAVGKHLIQIPCSNIMISLIVLIFPIYRLNRLTDENGVTTE